MGARHANEAISLIEEDYPFLGVCAREDSFDAVAVDVPVLAQGFSRAVDRVVDRSTCGDASELAVCIAAMLLERGAAARACAVVRSFATKPACASWLAAHGADLLSAACFKPAHELFVYAGKSARQNRILLAADEAVRLAALDDAACALFLARKFVSSRSIDPESRSLPPVWETTRTVAARNRWQPSSPPAPKSGARLLPLPRFPSSRHMLARG